MQLYEIGLSALRANQKGLAVTGQNIANASTPGYHRQRVELAARIAGATERLQVGSGVEVQDITRLRAQYIEQRIIQSQSDLAESQAALDVFRQLETLFPIGNSSLHARLGRFFDSWSELQHQPQDLTTRQIALARASELAQEFNRVDAGLHQTVAAVQEQFNNEVERLNRLMQQLAQVEQQVRVNEARGATSNELLDRRDLLLREISGLVDVRVLERGAAREVWLADGLLHVSAKAPQVAARVTAGGLSLVIAGTEEQIEVTRGSLGALIQIGNQTLPQLRQELDEFARQLTTAINQSVATGVDSLNGGLRYLLSNGRVSDPSLPLVQVLEGPLPSAGSLWINVIDPSTGATVLHSVLIDPAVDSLTDVADRIDLIPGLHARVDSIGRLVIESDTGSRFDFSGRLTTRPDVALVTGSADVSLAGRYTGEVNETWTAVVRNDGNVGISSSLLIDVFNGSGQLITTLEAGLGYEAGSSLKIAQGVEVRLGHGSLAAGDQFEIEVVGNPDSAGWLSRFGLGGVFTSHVPGQMAVRPELLQQPGLLTLSHGGGVADAGVVGEVSALRGLEMARGLTPEGYLADLTSRIGGLIAGEEIVTQGLEDELLFLEEQQAAVVGVDPNEEFLRLMEFQRGFQAGARFIQTVDNALDELMRLIR